MHARTPHLLRLLALVLPLAILGMPAAGHVPAVRAAAITPEIVSSFSVPGNRARSLAWGDGSLWLADVNQQLYRLSPAGAVQASMPISMIAYDMAWYDQSLWVHDGSKVYRLNTAGQVTEELPVGYWPMSGMEWVSDSLYVGDYNFSEIHKHQRNGSHVLSWQTSFFGHPTGMTYDGTGLWIGDSCEGGYNHLYRYTLLGAPLDSIDLDTAGISCDSARQSSRGLAWDGQYLWYTGDDTFTVYRLNINPLPPPDVTLITPGTARADAGNVAVTITGANFQPPVSAQLEGVALLDVTRENASSIRAVVPVGSLSEGRYDLTVTSAGKHDTLPGAFTVTPAAVVAEPTDSQWRRIGPPDGYPYSPEIGFVAVDPRRSYVIYASTDAGHTGDLLMRSADGGQTWPVFRDDYRSDVVAIDPGNSQILYTPGSDGSFASVFKSSDDGGTWNNTNCCGNGFLSAIVVDPHNSATVYAATTHAATNAPGVFRSSNGGASWTQVLSTASVVTLAIDPSDARVLYAGAETIPGNQFHPLYAGGLYRSQDGGASWTHILAQDQVTAIAIDPANPQTIYAATADGGIFKSSDQGGTWSRANHGLAALQVQALVLDPANPRVLYAGLWQGGVFRSVDAGASWRSINAGLSSTSVMALAIDPQQPFVVYAGTTGGLFQWVGPPPITGPHARVVNAQGNPLIGAQVYRNGVLLADGTGQPLLTNIAGELALPGLQAGDRLVAMVQQAQQGTVRSMHAGWAYRIFTTSMPIEPDGRIQAYQVSNPSGRQTLVVRPANSLVLFNLVVSIEWDASDVYIAEIVQAMRSASDYLYDVTDGQMAFGQVAIYDRAQHWDNADIQIATRNTVRPHAYIGGITSNDRAHVIRLGRGWNGVSGNRTSPDSTSGTGAWDQLVGFRTITHEFGHYALYLYDSYFGFQRDGAGNITGEIETTCTGLSNRDPLSDATNATIMDYQYTSSELSMRGVPALWSNTCEQTAQWQLNQESDWETILRRYGDPAAAPRWQLRSPQERGAVVPGPAGLPAGVLNLPQVRVENNGTAGNPRTLTVVQSDGHPFRGALVTLYRQNGQTIGQGLTDTVGELEIYGAAPGDSVRAASADASLYGETTVGDGEKLRIEMRPTSSIQSQARARVQVNAQQGIDPNVIDLVMTIEGLGPGASPTAIVTVPGSTTRFAPLLSYSPGNGSYTGQLSFGATQRGTGQIQLSALENGAMVWQHLTYRVQHVTHSAVADAFSDDGNLSLYLDSASIVGTSAYLVATTGSVLPGALPAGQALVGDAYTITASDGSVQFERPASMRFRIVRTATNSWQPIPQPDVWHWNGSVWQRTNATCDQAEGYCHAAIQHLGIYALLAPADDWLKPEHLLLMPRLQR